jgi:K+-sensing histidine kinase KdpD
MKDLSLHVLDIVQNAIVAKAKEIVVEINENSCDDQLIITIMDDGTGMSQETLNKVMDPFFTTRTVRQVGLGIPLIKMAAERCNGGIIVDSKVGQGTKVQASFQLSHIDRAPLGKMEETIMTLLNNGQEFVLKYNHQVNDKIFSLDTNELENLLEGVPINEPSVLLWVKEYVKEGLAQLRN